jgi:hypothetical protein
MKLKVLESLKYYCFVYKKQTRYKKFKAMRLWGATTVKKVFYALKAYQAYKAKKGLMYQQVLVERDRIIS